MFSNNLFKTRLPKADEALVGRNLPVFAGGFHAVLGNPMTNPMPDGLKQIVLGLGCFWGAERLFWTLPGGVCHGGWLCWWGDKKPHL